MDLFSLFFLLSCSWDFGDVLLILLFGVPLLKLSPFLRVFGAKLLLKLSPLFSVFGGSLLLKLLPLLRGLGVLQVFLLKLSPFLSLEGDAGFTLLSK